MSYRFVFENPTEGIEFRVDVITIASPATLLIASQITSVIFDAGVQDIDFTPGVNNTTFAGNLPGILYYETQEQTVQNPNPRYINWRSGNSVFFHPTTGRSFDIWFTPSVVQNIANGVATWQSLINLGQISLNPNFWSVFYDYDIPYAYGYIKGGTVRVIDV
jgi:hypothetical protein